MPQVQDTFSDFAGYVLAVDGAESHVRRSGAEYDAAIGVTEASAWNVDSLNDDEVASNGSSLSEIAALEAPRLRAETRLPPPPPPRRGSGRGGGRGGGAMLRGFGAPQPLDDEFPIQLLDVPPGRNGSNGHGHVHAATPAAAVRQPPPTSPSSRRSRGWPGRLLFGRK